MSVRQILILVVAAVTMAVVAAVVVILRRGEHSATLVQTERPSAVTPARANSELAAGMEHGFEDIAAESGINFRMKFLPGEQGQKFKINLYDHGCGVVVGDYDGDGHDDIYFLNQLGPNALYRNKGNGTFADVTDEAGVGLGDRICVGATFGDYDNDGDQDLYVTSTRGGNVLFQNQGGTFKDVTAQAGLALVAHSQTAAFFDYDNDGYLDLFVTNSAQWTTDSFDEFGKYFRGRSDLWQLAASPREYNVLYRNDGNGSFTDVTDLVALKGKGWGGDVAVFDFDGDGDLDLFVTNMFGQSQLYRNNGHGPFTEVTSETLERTSWGAIGSKAFDMNRDGTLDLLIADMHSDMWVPMSSDRTFTEYVARSENKKYRFVTGPNQQFDKRLYSEMEQQFADRLGIRYDDVLFGNTLFKNMGGGKFQEVSDRANIETIWPWGVATGDFNNDGHEDVFLPSGMGYPWFYWHNCLMMNNGDETFTDHAGEAGIDPPAQGIFLDDRIGGQPAARSSRCAATGDFDGDGRLEIVVNNFNDHAYYYKNNFVRRSYVAFRLNGIKSNWDAIGAIVKLHIGDEVMVRQVHAAGGYLSQSSKTVHFGLGDRSKIDRVEISWPSGVHQEIENPAIDVLHTITEPER